ncbi:MAG: hypothetical protein ABI411_20225 [Tahibacter sp.]
MEKVTFFEAFAARLSGSEAVAVFTLVVGAILILTAGFGRLPMKGLTIRADRNGRWVFGILGILACIPAFAAGIAKLLPSPTPSSTRIWSYNYVTTPDQLVTELNTVSPAPEDVWIIASWPNLHVWIRGKDSGTRYVFKRVPNAEAQRNPTDLQFFRHADGIIPVGWISGGSDFAYLQAFKEDAN